MDNRQCDKEKCPIRVYEEPKLSDNESWNRTIEQLEKDRIKRIESGNW